MKTRIAGVVLIVISLGILAGVAYFNSYKRQVPIVFSPRIMLESLWHSYKVEKIEPGSFRTVDAERGSITTSEGQSYTMLRAVWMADQETFDRSLEWTNTHLKRTDNNLFAWLYGRRANGNFGILSNQGGENTASDADTDIALALLFAYARWHNAEYLTQARAIINDIWEEEVVVVRGTPYLTANNVEKHSQSEWAVINPSYLAPYAYRIFATVDPDHDWMKLVDSSYEILNRSVSLPLDKNQSVRIPPDWIRIHKTTGELQYHPAEHLTTNYGFDAIRTPWRIALDYAWFKEPRAKSFLANLSFLGNMYAENRYLYAAYTHDGRPVLTAESPAMYGGAIGYFMIIEPEVAEEIYRNKLEVLYNPDSRSWKHNLSYYNDNWAWFGIALYNNMLPNLMETL
jgi:endoglucanase